MSLFGSSASSNSLASTPQPNAFAAPDANPVESPGGDKLELRAVGDGTPTEAYFSSYKNGESKIECGYEPALSGGEIYASCAQKFFTDAVTGEKAPDTDESTDTEFDACGKLVAGSHSKWYTPGTTETKSGTWIGGNDHETPLTAADACSGTWTIVYSYTQTFTNGETLTAEMSGSFEVTLPPAVSVEELYGINNPATPNHIRSCVGKPVDCATGNETLSQTDLMVGGLGIPLAFTRTYNAQAAVAQSVRGMLGYGWSSSYDDHLTINTTEEVSTVTVAQGNGSTVSFTGDGKPGALTAPAGVEAKLVLNDDGSYTYTLPSQESFAFNAEGQLLSEADRDGNTTTISRDAEGRIAAVTDPSGRSLAFAYNPEGMIESVTDPMGHAVRYSYEGGELAAVTLPGEAVPRWRFKYDSAHRLTELIDGGGGVTTNEYDSDNRVISQTDPAGHTLTFAYSATSTGEPETTITNHATGAVTREIFNGAYEPTSITDGFETASATTEKFVYNEGGALTRFTNGDGYRWTYTYDAEGNRTSAMDPSSNKTQWTYDTAHDLIAATTPDGETTTIRRDSHGNPEVAERPAPDGETQMTKYQYNALGELEAMTDPLGHTWSYGYDSNGDKTSETDPEGHKRTWKYDEDSLTVATVGARGNVEGAEPAKYTTTIERDQRGRPVAVTDPLGHETRYSYDGDGNLAAVTDPLGHETQYGYNADDEPTNVQAPDGTVTETGYDGAGEVISQTDGNHHTTKYVRNVLEQVVEVIDPKGRKTLKQYDAAGDLTKATDAMGRVTSWTYNPDGLPTAISYSDGTTHEVRYTYNGDGDRTHMTDGSGESSYVFDQLDRLTESTDGHGDVVGYAYNLANEPTAIAYPNGKTVAREYDADGQLSGVSDWLGHTTTFDYDPEGDLATSTFPAGTDETDSYGYDDAGRLDEVKMTSGGTTLASTVYGRNDDGEVAAEASEGLPGATETTYEYDANGELTKAGDTAYEYDAAGNPISVGANAYSYDEADELEVGGGTKYAFDEVGERVSAAPSAGNPTTYAYDQAGDLISVDRKKEGKTAGLTDSFTYDGDGLRVSQAIGGTTSFLTWQTNGGTPLLLSDGADSFVYGPEGVPIEQISGPEGEEHATYLHHDQAGSTRLLTNEKGEVTGAYSYTPYGATEAHTGTATTALGYDGQLTGPDTGLIYLRNRVYDPSTAQFLTVDPLVQWTRIPYTYANDNPLNSSDPTGLFPWESIAEGLGVGASCLLGPEVCVPVGLGVLDAHVIAADISSAETGCSPWPEVVPALVGAGVGALPFAGGVVAKHVWEASEWAYRLGVGAGLTAGGLAGTAASSSASPGGGSHGGSSSCGCSTG